MADQIRDGSSHRGAPPGLQASSEGEDAGRRTRLLGSGAAPVTPREELPPAALARDYGSHLRQIFESGLQVAQALHSENELLHRRIAHLERELEAGPAGGSDETLRLRAQLAAVTEERDGLRRELHELQQGVDRVRQENSEFAERYLSMERQNSNFISLYVASTQLHSTLEHGQVLQNIAEIVINLIGAEKFGVFLYDPAARELQCAVQEGLSDEERQAVREPEHLLFQVAQSGQLYLAPDGDLHGDGRAPIAIQPLVVANELVGLLVIYRLLVQKSGFEDIDLELFDLLAGHAATALMSSLLYKRTQRKAATLEGLLGLLKESGHLLDRSAKG